LYVTGQPCCKSLCLDIIILYYYEPMKVYSVSLSTNLRYWCSYAPSVTSGKTEGIRRE